MGFRFGDFQPMKCARERAPFDDKAYRFEPKLDGIRALAYADARGGVRLQARSGRDVTRAYPEATRAVAAALDGIAAVLDGELCALDARGVPEFARVLRREGVTDAARAEALAERVPVTYYAFDVLAVDDEPLLADPVETRRQSLVELAADLDVGFRVVDFLPARGKEAFRACVGVGYEGVVAKRLGSPYRPGERTRDWLKVKRAETADLVVGAWLPGKGALEGTVGALVLGAYDEDGALREVGRVGTGLTVADRRALHDALRGLETPSSPFAAPSPPGARFVRPRLVVEVEFLEVTRDGRLRAPTFRGVRADKTPAQCLLATELPGATG